MKPDWTSSDGSIELYRRDCRDIVDAEAAIELHTKGDNVKI